MDVGIPIIFFWCHGWLIYIMLSWIEVCSFRDFLIKTRGGNPIFINAIINVTISIQKIRSPLYSISIDKGMKSQFQCRTYMPGPNKDRAVLIWHHRVPFLFLNSTHITTNILTQNPYRHVYVSYIENWTHRRTYFSNVWDGLYLQNISQTFREWSLV